MHDATRPECETACQQQAEHIQLNHGVAMGCDFVLSGQANTAKQGPKNQA